MGEEHHPSACHYRPYGLISAGCLINGNLLKHQGLMENSSHESHQPKFYICIVHFNIRWGTGKECEFFLLFLNEIIYNYHFSKLNGVYFTVLQAVLVMKCEVIHTVEWLISLGTCGFWLLLTDSLPASDKSELGVEKLFPIINGFKRNETVHGKKWVFFFTPLPYLEMHLNI